MKPLLVMRPEPGASATARAAAALGLHPIVAPLFTVRALAWDPPEPSAFDGVLFTSANAVRHAGAGLARYRHLPAFAVGRATAEAARRAGFRDVIAGTRDAEHLIAAIDPATRILHPCGEHRRAPGRPMRQLPVYVSQAAEILSDAARLAITEGTVALIHSPRAATLFAALAAPAHRRNVDIVAISPSTSDVVGLGWRTLSAAPCPTDAAMLAIARVLCENDPP